jgi:hypothetical protein
MCCYKAYQFEHRTVDLQRQLTLERLQAQHIHPVKLAFPVMKH